MRRSARRPEPARSWTRPLGAGAGAVSAMIARNPVLVGGMTAFLVALSFVSANALWYQPHAHSGAFFATRDFAGETTITIERPGQARHARDPKTEQVQSILKEMNLYEGEIDGLFGPNTSAAIERYQAQTGIAVTGRVDDMLLDRLGAPSTTAGILPSPAPRPVSATTEVPLPADQSVVKVQAGLKAFGNDGVVIDGVMGEQTRLALIEFQALFGLPETGEPDDVVLAKMKQIGLIN